MKLIRNAAAVIVSSIILVLLAGCGSAPPKPSAENVRATKALEVLETMRQAYLAGDQQGVMARVSTSLEGGYSDFAGRLRKDMEMHDKAELTLTVERVEINGDETSVVFHWFGNWRDKQGKKVEARGNAVYTFAGETEMKLIRVVGDSPFGIVR